MQQQLLLFDIGQKGNNLRQLSEVVVIAIRHQSKTAPSPYPPPWQGHFGTLPYSESNS